MKKTRFSFVSIENMSTFAAQTKKQTLQSECSAVGSALRSGRRGRAFESPHPDLIKRSSSHELLRFLFPALKTRGIWNHAIKQNSWIKQWIRLGVT